MRKKVQYIDVADKQRVLLDDKGLILIEEQNIIDGNFLIFADVKPLENQISELNISQLILMDVIATMYEDMLAKGTV